MGRCLLTFNTWNGSGARTYVSDVRLMVWSEQHESISHSGPSDPCKKGGEVRNDEEQCHIPMVKWGTKWRGTMS